MKKNLKKVLAAGLATSMVIGMSIPACAAEAKYTDESSKTFTKIYESIGDGAYSPAETFEFENIKFEGATETGEGYDEEWAASHLPKISKVIYAAGAAGSANNEQNFVVTLPELSDYKTVGIYTYSFNEKDNNVEGVDYNNTKMLLKVTVIEEDGYKRVAGMHCENAANGETKKGTFINTYSAGKLSVKKVVTGNLGDQDKEFKIKVTFTAGDDDIVKSDITYLDGDETTTTTIDGDGWTTKEVEIYLNHDETIVFNNIPEGVSYTIEETDLANSKNEGATDKYEVTYTNEEGTISANAISEAVVTNYKNADVDTGISLDALPYLMMLGMSGLGALGFAGKRRKEEDEI